LETVITGDRKVPRELKRKAVLTHGQSVSSISFSSSGNYMTTGGKGIVKMWNTSTEALDNANNESNLKAEIECIKGAYIRSCKLTNDEKYMVVCGESKDIVVIDLSVPTPKVKLTMQVTLIFV
jgi:WD40 repeat protein